MANFQFINVHKIEKGAVTVHCVQSPEEGEMVNAQVIEGPTKLLLVDTLQLVPHSDELREYIQSLGKPLDRILISHHHPDHWFGTASFEGAAVYALPEVIGRINALADFLLDYHRSLHTQNPGFIPAKKVVPTEPLSEGEMTFDGIVLNLLKVTDTECPVNLAIELPAESILLAQDLVYNKAYPYFGERTHTGDYGFDNWIQVLQEMKAKNYSTVVPGHGDPTGAEIFDTMIGYLSFVKSKIEEGLRGEELIGAIKAQYPGYGLELTLQMSNYMLFVFQQEAAVES